MAIILTGTVKGHDRMGCRKAKMELVMFEGFSNSSSRKGIQNHIESRMFLHVGICPLMEDE